MNLINPSSWDYHILDTFFNSIVADVLVPGVPMTPASTMLNILTLSSMIRGVGYPCHHNIKSWPKKQLYFSFLIIIQYMERNMVPKQAE